MAGARHPPPRSAGRSWSLLQDRRSGRDACTPRFPGRVSASQTRQFDTTSFGGVHISNAGELSKATPRRGCPRIAAELPPRLDLDFPPVRPFSRSFVQAAYDSFPNSNVAPADPAAGRGGSGGGGGAAVAAGVLGRHAEDLVNTFVSLVGDDQV